MRREMDTEDLLRLLKEHKVDFVIIGATLQALKAFGYDTSDVAVDDLLTKKLLIRQYGVETDIHPFVKGTTFEKIWKGKVEASFGKTPVYFASLGDLIEMKKGAGRPQDLEDLKYLKRLKDKGEITE